VLGTKCQTPPRILRSKLYIYTLEIVKRKIEK
jgi:hypothetical protein